MTIREFNILFKLLSYPKKTFSRQQLMDEFWDADTSSGPRTVDVYMTKLRAKLSHCTDFEIQTVHGLGYFVLMSVYAKRRSWLSICLSLFGGMLLFMMVPMMTPLDSGVGNVGMCLIGGAIFATGIGAVSNLILKNTNLVG